MAPSCNSPSESLSLQTKANMEKYYFASWIVPNQPGGIRFGNGQVKVTDMSTVEIEEMLQKDQGYSERPRIICLKDLTFEEFLMLGGVKE